MEFIGGPLCGRMMRVRKPPRVFWEIDVGKQKHVYHLSRTLPAQDIVEYTYTAVREIDA